MKIAAVCCTYKRPRLLGQMVAAYEAQDLDPERRELIILDDAGQYPPEGLRGPGWRLVSIDRRFRTLGEKRNAAVALAGPEFEALAVWDDDDHYFPWALSATVAALERAPWSRPSVVLDRTRRKGVFRQHETGGLFHGGWGYRREAFLEAGGYPPLSGPEDQGLLDRMQARGTPEADPIELGFQPFYFYDWKNVESPRISGIRGDAYAAVSDRPCKPVAELSINLPPEFAGMPEILPGVRARAW